MPSGLTSRLRSSACRVGDRYPHEYSDTGWMHHLRYQCRHCAAYIVDLDSADSDECHARLRQALDDANRVHAKVVGRLTKRIKTQAASIAVLRSDW